MVKKSKIAPANDIKENPVETLAAQAVDVSAPEAAAPATPRTRGPRGTEETSKITLVATTNPKRAGSKAAGRFDEYKDQMTIKDFCDAVGKAATSNLVYDAKHGFITIEGYDPGAIITPKPKAEKVAKEPKAPKAKKGKKEVVVDGTLDENKAALEAETREETME